MPNSDFVTDHSDAIATLRQTLRSLNNPAQLAQSAWIDSALTKHQMRAEAGTSSVQALRAILDQTLMQLAQTHLQQADLLRGRYWEELPIQVMLRHERPTALRESSFYKWQKEALERFALLLTQQEQTAQQANPANRLRQRLPIPSYDRLFGMDRAIEQVLAYFAHPQQHPIISVKGIGGIGKTALADYVVRRIIEQEPALHDLIWLSAKQEYLTPTGILAATGATTQIRVDNLFDEMGYKLGTDDVQRLPLAQKVDRLATILRANPYLVIIDNLETVADFEQLLPWLIHLATPTCFLLTCRQTLPSLTTGTTVELDELDQQASLDLINHMAQKRDVTGVVAADVYTLTGGNPLAILLTVSQMKYVPSAEVFRGVQMGTAEEMYRYIYWTSWHSLTDDAQALLFTIQRAGDQADWAWLTTVSDISKERIQRAVQRLHDQSLIQLQRDEQGQTVYTIHRLTSTFLRTEVLGWV